MRKLFDLFGKLRTQPMAGSDELLDLFPEKLCTATLLCHSIERMVNDFTLLSPPFSVIAPLCVGGGGGGRSHYNRCFMTGLFHFVFSAGKKRFIDAGFLLFRTKN